jgi:hypothetical protein
VTSLARDRLLFKQTPGGFSRTIIALSPLRNGFLCSQPAAACLGYRRPIEIRDDIHDLREIPSSLVYE